MAITASNEPTAINAVIYKGSLWHYAFPILDATDQLVPTVDGLSPRAQIRARPTDESPLFTFTELTINPDTKAVELKVPGAVSAAWTWRTGYLEVEVIDASSEVHTIAAGTVRTRENIAR
jgi:hypothetical protein